MNPLPLGKGEGEGTWLRVARPAGAFLVSTARQFGPAGAFLLSGLAIQITAVRMDGDEAPAKPLLLAISYLVTFAGALIWRRSLARSVLLAGLLLNATVIAANGGLMPVTPEAVESASGYRPPEGASPPGAKDVVLPRQETRLYGLTDRIPVSTKLLSIGDFVLAAGLLLWAAGEAREVLAQWVPALRRPFPFVLRRRPFPFVLNRRPFPFVLSLSKDERVEAAPLRRGPPTGAGRAPWP